MKALVKNETEELYISDVFLLDYFNQRKTDYELAEYQIETYGSDYKERLSYLYDHGFLTIAGLEETLTALTIPELKNILRTFNLKLSGKKQDLVARIVDTVPSEKIKDSLPKLYALTSKGSQFLLEHKAFIDNKKQGYGFLNNEIFATEKILATRGTLDSDGVFFYLFQRNVVKHGKNKDFDSLKHTYYQLSLWYKKKQDFGEALKNLLASMYLDLSGMGDDNTVYSYRFRMESVFGETMPWQTLDNLITVLKIKESDFPDYFQRAIDYCAIAPPFSYFSAETMINIILDRLRGQENLLERYEQERNIPDEHSSEYDYWNFDKRLNLEVPAVSKHSESEEELKTASSSISSQAPVASGCLIPCILLVLIFIIAFAAL